MKDDTVSRAAVMESLTKEYNRRRTGDGLKLAWIEKAVNEVPAVQPKDPENGSASCINPEKMHDRTMDECISRQAVLKSIDDYERLSAVSQTVRNMTSLREVVQWLPSAQPEKRTEEHTETHACDLISRQAAIDAFKKELTTGEPKGKYVTICSAVSFEGAKQILEALPSAQPQPEIIRCKDCKYFKGVTSFHGDCECDDMWRSLYGEITEVEAIDVHINHYCGYAERRTDGSD